MAVAAVLLLSAVPSAVHAHSVLRRSEPAARAHLHEAPRRIRLTFSEAQSRAFTRITLRSPAGDLALGPVRIVDDTIALAEVQGLLAPGAYTVLWQIAGADGHPVRGEFQFSITENAAGIADVGAQARGEAGGVVPAPAQPGPPVAHHVQASQTSAGSFDAESPAFVAIRALLYFALVGVIGAVTFNQLLARPGAGAASVHQPVHIDAIGRAASIGTWAAGAAIVVIGSRLLAQSYAMHGDRALDGDMLLPMLTQTRWGWGWIAQLLASLIATAGLLAARNGAAAGRDAPHAWRVATLAAVVLGLTPALASHAAAAPRFSPLAMAADGLHVLAAGAWMGSLLLILAAGIPAALARRDSHAIVTWVRRFSPVALTCGAILAATGTFAAWLHIGSIPGLWSTTYGRVLLVKLAVLGAIGAAGFFNWRFVLPRLEQDGASGRLSRSGTVELAFGGLVLIVTAVLVALPTP